MATIRGLKCRECGEEYPLAALHVCEFCFGPLEVVYNYDQIAETITRARIEAGPRSIWRYRDLLPVGDGDIVDLGTGWTPLTRADQLGRALGLRNLYLKNDCVNPSYSFKDRVVAVAINKAIEFGFDTVACASTGNLACSVAAHGAKTGLRTVVFIPADLEQGKIIGANIYDPVLVAVEGNYDQVNRVCSEIADKYNWAFVNINVRPYYAEGSKTLGFEVAEQLGWRAPDHVVVPVASGSLLVKIKKGLDELCKVGLIPEVRTRVSAAQALGCSPVVTAFKERSTDIRPVKPSTIAKSLAIGNPADGYYGIRTIYDSGGCAESATDDEIVEGMRLLARTEGIFAETAGGVTVAVLKKLAESKRIDPDELTVAYITGNGLKTQEAVADRLRQPVRIRPTISSFEEAMRAADATAAEMLAAR